jgi:hypothetical protein
VKKLPKKMGEQKFSIPLSFNSENLDIKHPLTQREKSEVDGYGISFNEKEQLKYKGLMLAQAQQAMKPKSLRNESVEYEEQMSR